jgi:hypothetical protein
MKKTKTYTIGLILLLAISAFIIAIPSACARTKNSFPVCTFSSNPVGVNQQVLILYGIVDYTTWPQTGWEGLWVTIERPDGQTDTFEDLKTDTTGLSAFVYTPTTVGTHNVKVYFPEQEVLYSTRSLEAGTILLASESRTHELVVQEDPILYHPGFSLPNEYWTRPIDSQQRESNRITGNWLEDSDRTPNRYAPGNEYAPDTAHILWTRPLSMGGLAGGMDDHAFSCGDAYEGLFQDRVIIGGVLYYNAFNTRSTHIIPPESQEVVAIDLHTGEVLWQKPLQTPDGAVGSLDFGQVFYWDGFNHHAVYPYLWDYRGSTWHAFDPFSGVYSMSIEDVPGGTRVHAENGDINIYTINQNAGWMSKWSMVQTVNPRNYGSSHDGSWGRYIGYDYPDRVYPAETGIVWNVTIPDLPTRTTLYMEDRIIGTNCVGAFGIPETDPEFWAISLKPGQEGQLMWRKEWTLPVADLWVCFTPNFQPTVEDGVFIIQAKETGQNWGFDINSGNEVWGPTDRLPDIAESTNLYAARWGQAVGADGIVVLGGGMGGSLRGHDVKTGVELWRKDFVDEHQETLFSPLWPMTPQFVTDGKVYVAHLEHSPLDPKGRDCPFVVLDLETGEVVFETEGLFRSTRWGGQHIIGDSIMALMDSYDQRVYAVGKGPSSLTVEKTMISPTLGSSVTVQGTVMDASPGTEDPELKLKFPAGVPAISDADMSDWMRYVYKDFNRPAGATGVVVKVEAVDPNGNYQDYGSTTSDAYGNFALPFVPEVPGTYMIIATFEGSDAYYGSTGITYITIDEAPSPSTPIEPEEPEEPEEPVVPSISTEVAITIAVAVIAIIGVAAYWFLKRK